MTGPSAKDCPFLAGEDCLQEECMAWRKDDCSLIRLPSENQGPFEQKLKSAAPLMYRSLLDQVKVMEETSKDCGKCGPVLWNYAQEIRSSLLDELIRAELAEAGIKG
jgi:hypothetical protein